MRTMITRVVDPIDDTSTVHIIGGGLVGTMAALHLAKQGLKVVIHENRPDIRTNPEISNRSINLSITARGLKALDEVGLKQKALAIAVPKTRRIVHSLDGRVKEIPYGKDDSESLYSISREMLNGLLLDEAEKNTNITIRFNQYCADYDINTKELIFVDEHQHESKVIAPVVIGADGAGAESIMREILTRGLPGFESSRSQLEYGYKELSIDDRSDMPRNALHIWARGDAFLIALPRVGGRGFRGTLFMPLKGDVSFDKLRTPEAVEAYFSQHFPDAKQLMPNLAKDFFLRPYPSFMHTVRCNKWHIGGNVMIIGDAAHAVTPFYAQGMNAGFEDCSALGELVERHKRGGRPDWETIFSRLERERKPNTDAIAEMSLRNFQILRTGYVDPKAQLKLEVEQELEKRHPDRFGPRYGMVSFRTDIGYAEAQRRGNTVDGILEELCGNTESIGGINWGKAAKLVNERLEVFPAARSRVAGRDNDEQTGLPGL